MVNVSPKRHLISNINHNDDKFSHHSHKKNPLAVYHQNICGLGNKINELITFLHPNFPDILCLTEHQLKQAQLELPHLEGYHLGFGSCRQNLRKGEVSIFVYGDLKFSKVNIHEFSKEQHITACAIKIKSSLSSICVIAIYRALSGDLKLFIDSSDNIIKKLYKTGLTIVLCGDFNINLLKPSGNFTYQQV
jgi:exonuclease III